MKGESKQSIMKKIIAGLYLIAGVSLNVFAQEGKTKTNYPYHLISKDVQRLQFRNYEFVPARISTGDLATLSSKGVNQINAKKATQQTGTVVTGGTPSWVISKGMARMQYERKK
jgi:hypothetical protein